MHTSFRHTLVPMEWNGRMRNCQESVWMRHEKHTTATATIDRHRCDENKRKEFNGATENLCSRRWNKGMISLWIEDLYAKLCTAQQPQPNAKWLAPTHPLSSDSFLIAHINFKLRSVYVARIRVRIRGRKEKWWEMKKTAQVKRVSWQMVRNWVKKMSWIYQRRCAVSFRMHPHPHEVLWHMD